MGVLTSPFKELHQLYECERISSFISIIFGELRAHCKTALDIEESRDQYIFGFQGKKHVALNQILLELKVFNFYYIKENPQTREDILQKIYFARIKKIILREKDIALLSNKYDEFDEKWENFTYIYDYRGPDIDIVP